MRSVAVLAEAIALREQLEGRREDTSGSGGRIVSVG
jgi:hypothetical protein